MRLFKWDALYMVHMPEIDSEHQKLFRLADDLHRAIQTGAAGAAINGMLQELVKHAMEHFEHEERMMREVSYPAYEWHKKQHVTLTAKVTGMIEQFEAGEPHAPLELLRTLSDWIKDHSRTSDTMMAAYLRNHQRAHAARAS